MSKQLNTVVLILKKGGDFHFSDAMLLATQLHKHQPNVRVLCFTDIVKEETQLKKLTLLPFPVKAWQGWWSKMNLFAPTLEQYRPFIYFDLDTAILSNVQSLFNTLRTTDGLVLLEDLYWVNKEASGVIGVPANNKKVKKLWKTWIQSPDRYIKQYRGDQNFISAVTPADVLWQRELKCVMGFKPTKKWLMKLPVPSPSVICFHGYPRIPEAASLVHWVNEYVNGRL